MHLRKRERASWSWLKYTTAAIPCHDQAVQRLKIRVGNENFPARKRGDAKTGRMAAALENG